MIVGIDQLALASSRTTRSIPKVPLALISEIERVGQIRPVVTRRLSKDRFEILTNAETWLAVQRLGIHDIKIVVRENLSDVQAQALIDTRIDPDPIAEAEWLQQQLIGQGGEHESVTALAGVIGLSRSYISHAIRLLSLDPEIQVLLTNGQLKVGHAKAILSLSADIARLRFTRDIITKKWTVRQSEKQARNINKSAVLKTAIETKSTDVISLENSVSEIVGSRVEIDEAGGKITIDYRKNLDVLDGILSRLGYNG